MVPSPFGPDTPRPLDGSFVPHNLMPNHGSPVPVLKFQIVPRLRLLTPFGSKKKEPNMHVWVSRRLHTRTERELRFSSSASHLLLKGLSISPIKHRCHLRVIYPVRRPVTSLDCVLLKDSSLVFAVGLGHEISFRVCLYVLIRRHHIAKCWMSIQRLIFPLIMQLLNHYITVELMV